MHSLGDLNAWLFKHLQAFCQGVSADLLNPHVTPHDFSKLSDSVPLPVLSAESLIRLTKTNVASSIGSNILTISELQTALFEIANLSNERPIGIRAGDPTEKYICPNDLLMGRASKDAPIVEFVVSSKLLKRLAICQEIVQHFYIIRCRIRNGPN